MRRGYGRVGLTPPHRSLATVAALAAVFSLVGAIAAPRGEASCVAMVTYHGRTYVGYQPGPALGGALSDTATRPGCNDVATDPPLPREPDVQVKMHALRDVDPIIAIADENIVYVNASTFVALRSHPLHRFYGTGKPPRPAGPPCRVHGRAVVGEGAFGVRTGKRIVRVRVTADTRVELQRHGTGYVPDRARITVTATSCTRLGGVRWITATRISR